MKGLVNFFTDDIKTCINVGLMMVWCKNLFIHSVFIVLLHF